MAHDYHGERLLGIRSDTGGERCGKESQTGDGAVIPKSSPTDKGFFIYRNIEGLPG
jgi:hypothetical protein